MKITREHLAGLELAILLFREAAAAQPGYSDEREAIFERLIEARDEAQSAPAAGALAWRMFDGEGGYQYTDDLETVERWKAYLGGKYATWISPLFDVVINSVDHLPYAELVELLREAAETIRDLAVSADKAYGGHTLAGLRNKGDSDVALADRISCQVKHLSTGGDY